MTELHISCAAVGRYVPHSAALLHSALACTRDAEVTIHYLHAPSLGTRSRERLSGLVSQMGGTIAFHEIADSHVAGLPVRGSFTSAMWYRTFLTDLLPGVERVLYLDVDTLVVRSLAPLSRIDLAGRYLGAVTNVLLPTDRHLPAQIGLAGPEVYFNSGVLLLNLDELRADRAMEAVRDCARARSSLTWPDQDALNLVLGERRVALHPRWNCMNSVMAFPWASEVFGAGEVDEARRDPAIRHFEGPGPNKPWHLLYSLDRADLYREHRRATPWPRTRPAGVTPGNVVRRLTQRRPVQGLTARRPV